MTAPTCLPGCLVDECGHEECESRTPIAGVPAAEGDWTVSLTRVAERGDVYSEIAVGWHSTQLGDGELIPLALDSRAARILAGALMEAADLADAEGSHD